MFPLGGRLRRRRGWPDKSRVRAVELVPQRSQLPLLELADDDAPPPIGRADDRGVHQLQHGALTEGMRHDLGPAPLLEEEALQEVFLVGTGMPPPAAGANRRRLIPA